MNKQQLNSYDHIIVAFSGGKDSLASLLHILEAGADPAKIELWHHSIDGREGSRLMDWGVTDAYCKAVADAFGLPIYYSWRIGGFERELTKHNTMTAPVLFECPDGQIRQAGGLKGTIATRRKFPQQGSSDSGRWCSSNLKIEVMAFALRGQERFTGKRTLIITGERGEESPSRDKYNYLEPHKTHCKSRHVDHFRPVLRWTEAEVWEIIKFYNVNPHPAYKLGVGRVSCAGCIFGDANQWATLLQVNPTQTQAIAAYEIDFGTTISRKGINVLEQAQAGQVYAAVTADRAQAVNSHTYTESIFTDNWELPAGAFSATTCGPN